MYFELPLCMKCAIQVNLPFQFHFSVCILHVVELTIKQTLIKYMKVVCVCAPPKGFWFQGSDYYSVSVSDKVSIFFVFLTFLAMTVLRVNLRRSEEKPRM